MRNLFVQTLLAVAIFNNASFALANDKMCPDYSQYREVLNEGTQTLKHYPGSFSGPIDPNSMRNRAIPITDHDFKFTHTVEPEIIQKLDQLSSKPGRGIDNSFEILCFHAARCLFSGRQFSDAIDFLEKVSKVVKPNTICSADTSETLADAHWMEVFGGDPEYSILVPAFDAFKKKATFTRSEDEHLKQAQQNYSKTVDYLESSGRKVDKVRIYVYLSAIANHFNDQSEAIRLKDKALSSFFDAKDFDEKKEERNIHLHLWTYGYPCLFTENSRSVFNNTQLWHSYPFTYLHDLIACARAFQDNSSIVKLSEYWLANKHPMPLPGDALPLIIQYSPESARWYFPDGKLEDISQYSAVYGAFLQKGWREHADALKQQVLNNTDYKDSFGDKWKVALGHLENNELPEARKFLTQILVELRRSLYGSKDTVEETLSRLRLMQQTITQLKNASLKEYEQQISMILVDIENRLQKLECLSLAKKLSDTGWQLEKRGDPDAARKMYKSALDIKRKNLDSNDREIALTLCDLARLEANGNNPKAAEPFFIESLAIFRKKTSSHDLEYRAALESYAGFLKKNNRLKEAERIYQEARIRT